MRREKTAMFIGHSYIYETKIDLREQIKKEIENLIKLGVEEFFCGGMGDFDVMSAECMNEMKKKYPHVKCTLVIPYMKFKNYDAELYDELLAYGGIERYLPKYSIPRRNQYMVENSAYAICYVKYSGGAWDTYNLAKKEGLTIVNLAGVVDIFKEMFLESFHIK